MYSVNHSSYCGMRDVPACFDNREEARAYVAARLRRYRHRFPVATLSRGVEWEILEPDGVAMVPDACGVLSLDRTVYECRECGWGHDTPSEALHCCSSYDECAR